MRGLLAVLLCCAAAPMARADEVQSGLWELTLSMTVAATAQPVGPFQKTQCFTQEDVKNPGRLFGELGADCTYSDKQYQGNRFTFTIQCGGPVPLSGTGSVDYRANAFEGDVMLNANMTGVGQLETRSHISGTRIGGC